MNESADFDLRIGILGTVGVPGNYGGFETLAEQLVAFHARTRHASRLTVYCSSQAFSDRSPQFLSARRRFIPINANGVSSILYDIWSMFDAALSGTNKLLVLGVSGALAFPILRLFPGIRIITNIDGVEWRREKWKGLARHILRWSEWAAVSFSHEVIADNRAIADYVSERYGRLPIVIAYGGNHALEAEPDKTVVTDLPNSYALAICRIEPENNVTMILEAFATSVLPLVFVGNWDRSAFGRDLKARYANCENIIIHDAIYGAGALRAIRDRASVYVHGHSAGGTNPSLVEMMHFGIPILAYDCAFNRHTTQKKARYFVTSEALTQQVREVINADGNAIGDAMIAIARKFYTWDKIAKAYFDLLGS